MKNWDNLRYFLAVVNAGTVNAAASSMGVSHTTVLRRIDQLEQEIEATLFKRLQSGYELTDFGHSILDSVTNIRQHVDQLDRQIKGQDTKLEGCLRISQPENEVLDMYPIYREFNRLYPKITLQITSAIKVSNLKRHEVDVALRFSECPQDLLVGRCIGQLDFGVYGSRDYLKKFDKHPSFNDLDWIIFKSTTKKRLPSDEWISNNVSKPKISVQTPSSSGILNAIHADMGVGFLSILTANKYTKLKPIPLSEPAFSLKLWVLTHKDLRHTAMVKVFMQHVADSLEKELR